MTIPPPAEVQRIVYLGTPATAVPPLRALCDAGYEIALVVSRPDTRRGRGVSFQPSPVKAAALDLGLDVSDDLEDLAGVTADLGVVVAYGEIIPPTALEQVSMVNLHFSLLPRWRGAAPVERAILAGDEVTGVCLMALSEGLDTGAVYRRAETPIDPEEECGALRARLVTLGTEVLIDALARGLVRQNRNLVNRSTLPRSPRRIVISTGRNRRFRFTGKCESEAPGQPFATNISRSGVPL